SLTPSQSLSVSRSLSLSLSLSLSISISLSLSPTLLLSLSTAHLSSVFISLSFSCPSLTQATAVEKCRGRRARTPPLLPLPSPLAHLLCVSLSTSLLLPRSPPLRRRHRRPSCLSVPLSPCLTVLSCLSVPLSPCL